MKERSSIFADSFSADAGIAWHLSRLTTELHADKFVLDGVQSPFDIEEFADEKQCTLKLATDVHAQLSHSWSRAHGLQQSAVNAVYDATWQKHELRVVVAQWRAGFDRVSTNLVVADSEEIARAFANACCAFCNDPRRSVLRFSDGCWSRSRELYTMIQAATFDDLILADDLARTIREDFSRFLAAKAEYERYGVPHKRGVLFVGPPGNGKTHCLRALIKFLDVPCLYVMSLKAQYATEQSSIQQVFQRARETSPCCLVFEDLDAMINDKNRSFFLNQLDGLAHLDGVLTLATTNHPDKLDPAIVDRPSRFDRKYHFNLPGPVERRAYLSLWNTKLDAAMRLSDDELAALVDGTADFSFAYLKELYLSAMVRWIVQRKPGAMAAELREQLEVLRKQMRSGATAMGKAPAPKHPPMPGMPDFEGEGDDGEE